MNVHDAFMNATQAVLGELLAPELADKMAEEIMTRARADLEVALGDFVGFDLARAGAAKGRGNKQKATASSASTRGRKPRAQEPRTEAASGAEAEPTPEAMS